MAKRIRLSGLGCIIVMLLLTACNFPNPNDKKPTLTAPPAEVSATPASEAQVPENSAQCVAGIWEIQDVVSFLNTNLPKDLIPGQNIQFTKADGHLRYTFEPDGRISVSADNFQLNAAAKLGPLNLNGTAEVKGSGNGTYAVNEPGRTIEISNLKDQGFTVSASIAGNQILADTPIDSLIWFGSGKNAVINLAYTCISNQLTVSFNSSDPSIGSQTITLVRSNH